MIYSLKHQRCVFFFLPMAFFEIFKEGHLGTDSDMDFQHVLEWVISRLRP